MQTVSLGNSGVKVSRVGIGAMQAGSGWGAVDDEIVDAVRESSKLGVSLVDTAEGYGKGHSETVVGRAIAKVGRENLVIATKVAGLHLRYDDVLRACDASLARLGIKQIDLYQIHSPNPWEQIPLKFTMKAMEKLLNEGKIRAIGVSNFAVRDLEEASGHLAKAEIASNQVRYNLLERQIEEEVLPYCRKNRITILAWSPLAQGALTGKYGPGKMPIHRQTDNPLFSKRNLTGAKRLVDVLKKVGASRGKTPSQVALNWLTRNKPVVPIPGARNPDQAEQNAMSVGWTLTASEAKSIEEASGSLKMDYFDV
jgi:myo-inositol catabolism protein IolS